MLFEDALKLLEIVGSRMKKVLHDLVPAKLGLVEYEEKRSLLNMLLDIQTISLLTNGLDANMVERYMREVYDWSADPFLYSRFGWSQVKWFYVYDVASIRNYGKEATKDILTKSLPLEQDLVERLDNIADIVEYCKPGLCLK